MADLAALLRAYTLQAGDVVFIDSGSYTLLTDATLSVDDSGATGDPVTFQGPTNGDVATLNRANDNGNVFFINGASNVVIQDLTLTGGNMGIYVADDSSSNAISINDVAITDENTYGVFFGSGDTGLSLTNSQIYGNYNGSRNTGLYAVGSTQSSTAPTITVTGDKILRPIYRHLYRYTSPAPSATTASIRTAVSVSNSRATGPPPISSSFPTTRCSTTATPAPTTTASGSKATQSSPATTSMGRRRPTTSDCTCLTAPSRRGIRSTTTISASITTTPLRSSPTTVSSSIPMLAWCSAMTAVRCSTIRSIPTALAFWRARFSAAMSSSRTI